MATVVQLHITCRQTSKGYKKVVAGTVLWGVVRAICAGALRYRLASIVPELYVIDTGTFVVSKKKTTLGKKV